MLTLSTTYANNLGTNSTKWLALKNVSYPANTAVSSDPDVPFFWIKADKPFIFNTNGGKSPNVIIQFDIRPRRRAGPRPAASPSSRSPPATASSARTRAAAGR
ncbi:MAG: hypothetical protein R3F30_06140 [Planctomycetota bacterium]